MNETALYQGRAVSSLTLYAQAKSRLIDSGQNGTCANHYLKTNNVGSGTRSGISPLQARQERIQDFFKEGVVSMRVQGKHPRAKGMG